MSAFSLSLQNLHCERDERVLFSGLSAEFKSGAVVQVAGPNGAGKTTLLKILTGLSSEYEGDVQWCGKSISGFSSYHFYSSLLYFGHLPGIKSSLTAMENLQWYFGLNGVKSANNSAEMQGHNGDINSDGSRHSKSSHSKSIEALLGHALDQVGLAGYETVPCQQMSAGQQRRVGLARLFCSKAPLWILDEPFTAIDKKGVSAIESLIAEHAATGGLVLLTTHQPLAIASVLTLDLADFQVAAA